MRPEFTLHRKTKSIPFLLIRKSSTSDRTFRQIEGLLLSTAMNNHGKQRLRRSAEILVLDHRWTLRITRGAFQIFLQPYWPNQKWFFNSPIIARTQVPFHRRGRRTRILTLFRRRTYYVRNLIREYKSL